MKSEPEIKIYCTASTPRLEYIAGFLTDSMGIPFIVSRESSSAVPSAGEYSIYYGQQIDNDAVTIYEWGLLKETGIRQTEPQVIKQSNHTLLFPAPQGYSLPFDLFSAIFYLISRYEEYSSYIPDQYGRFEAMQSHAYRNDYLQEPVVDQWILILQETLLKKYPSLRFTNKKFQFKSTFDIDNPWAFHHKGILRNLAGMAAHALRLDFSSVLRRIKVLTGTLPDPFDVYPFIRQMEDQYGFRSTFFFLSGNYGQYDVNYALNTKGFKELIRTMNSGRATGIHPSYKSNSSRELLSVEIKRFTAILGKRPEISRQHFLMIRMPETYKRLISVGITSDYSMGYASLPGFRAGTSLPFKFFDLQDERELPLLIHPFAVMDVTLKQYLHLEPAEASAQINILVRKIKDVNGIFIPLWHNESLSDQGIWKGWRKVFEDMVSVTALQVVENP